MEARVGFEPTNGGFAGPYAFRYPRTRTGAFSYGLALILASVRAGGLLILGTPKSARLFGNGTDAANVAGPEVFATGTSLARRNGIGQGTAGGVARRCSFTAH